jgi:ABC-type polysaccharide/polyol phosphate export permease
MLAGMPDAQTPPAVHGLAAQTGVAPPVTVAGWDPSGAPPTPLARMVALFRNFLAREVRGRYLGTRTGLAWALLQPLALLGVYYVVFTSIFKVGSLGTPSFLAFVAIGLWPWLAAQEALQRGTTSLAGYAGLIRKAAFPHETIVYASVAATLLLHFTGYLVVLGVLTAFGQPIHLAGLLVAIPLWLVLAIAVTGLTLILASLQVFVRDVEHVLMPILMMTMYLTPILYPLTVVPESMRPWVAANPFAWLVTRFRDALLEGRLAFAFSDLVALAVALALLATGLWMFRRLSPYFEDFL